jgi:glucose-6-phosphate isomerase
MLRYDYSNMLSPKIKNFSLSEKDLYSLNSFDKSTLTFRDLIFKNPEDIEKLGREISEKYKNYIVVGIGGSDLGSRTIVNSLKNISGTNIDFIGANTDPDEIEEFFKRTDIKSSLFNVISKSGETVEIIANFLYIQRQIEIAGEDVSSHIVVTTSAPNTTIRDLCKRLNIRIIEGVENVGDRFSVLSVIGLLTAAVMGCDIKSILAGAQNIDKNTNSLNPKENEALMFAQLQYLYFKNFKKNISVLMPYSKRLERFGFWYRQLLAESIGKKLSKEGEEVFAGITPIASLGSTDQHSQIQLYNEGPNDKTITFIIPKDFDSKINIETDIDTVSYLNGVSFEKIISTERLATSIALTENDRANGTIFIDKINEESLGELFYFFELAISYLGEMFNIDTFNQPGVEKGKEYMYSLLSKPGFEEQKKYLEKYLNHE